MEAFLVFAVDSYYEVNVIKDRIERGIITLFTHEGHAIKKTLMMLIVNLCPFSTKIEIDSATPRT